MRRLLSHPYALVGATAAFMTLSLSHDSVPIAVPTIAALSPVPDVPVTLTGQSVLVSLLAASGRLALSTTDGKSRREMDLSLVVDGAESVAAADLAALVHVSESAVSVPLLVPGLPKGAVVLSLVLDEEANALTVSLTTTPSSKRVALRFGMAPLLDAVFVPGRGGLADAGDVVARAVVLDDGAHPLALIATTGELSAELVAPEFAQTPSTQPRLVLTTSSVSAGAGARIVLPESTQDLWGAVYGVMQVPLARVTGVVTGTSERARVVAIDEQGHPLLRLWTKEDGRFEVDAPPDAVRWYANLEASHTSPPVRHAFGTTDVVKLHISAGGELHVKVIDPDTGKPIVARLVVRGLDGAVDPDFQGDFRGRGAGPLMDLRVGETQFSLPAGKYRVEATKGIEWSIDGQVVQVGNGRTNPVELHPRHVVPTPGAVGCDLHVHARPSFDSSVTPEDRVMSLVSAGIDFAVPTEHNRVGDYGPAIESQHLESQLAWVHGVEVTTYQPRLGHFGVFPYPKNGVVPPYRATNLAAVFAGSRKGDDSRVLVVHHPRLPLAIGYFDAFGLDTKSGRIPPTMRTDFDVLEVYNGYEVADRAKVERVLDDWFGLLELGKRMAASGSSDSHKLQYQWAGYPRTYADIGAEKAGDADGAGAGAGVGGGGARGAASIDTKAVIDAVKRGRGFVTSGPIIELDVDGAHAGDEAPVRAGMVTAHIRVRAAPWVDVSSIQVVAGRSVVFQTELPAHKTVTGVEEGTLEEAMERTVRFDRSVDVRVPPDAKWLVVVVRGNRSYEDVLPFMAVQPLAFTNPVWLVRKP